MTPRIRKRHWLSILAGICLSTGCATDAVDPLVGETVEVRPMGGESLTLRRRELERAHRDMLAQHATLESLHQRSNLDSFVVFKRFLEGYFEIHLDPLLTPEWQSRHPELQGLDANVRVMEAELQFMLGNPRQEAIVLDDLDRRFAGRTDLLVDYPVGEMSTLSEAIRILRERRWKLRGLLNGRRSLVGVIYDVF